MKPEKIMTRKEAITWIEEHSNPYLDQTLDSQAHRLAIEALKQPEIIMCKDCKFSKDPSGAWDRRCSMLGVVADDFFCKNGRRKEEA